MLDEAAVTLGRATNNVAEYRGLLLGLERARALGATEVEVVNDSELIARQVNGRYKVKHPDMVPLHRRGAARAARVRALVDPLGAARAERRRGRAGQPGAGRRRLSAEPEPAGGTEYAAYLLIDDLLLAAAPDHARARTTSCCSSSSTSPTSCGSS